MVTGSSCSRVWLWLFLLQVAIPAARAAEVAKLNTLPPPEARPGECYAKTIVPAKYNEVRQTIVKREASEVISIVPARYEWVEEKVVVKEASETIEVIPATYRWIEEKVLVEPASFELVPVATEFESVAEKVLDTPAQISWSNQCGPLQSVEHMTGDILCLVSEPATHKTITRHVVSEPATTRRVERPAVFKMVRRQVLDTPARVVRTPQPAQYEKVRVRKLVAPEQVERTLTPIEYQSVTRKEKVSDEHFAWLRVICDASLDETMIRGVQRALKKRGFYSGKIDGIFGAASRDAVEAFQSNDKLARGALTVETLEALGVDQ